ncbi:MAG: hypothetical protein JNL21_38255 [Myxococcales bacterium]|nr:hypothetical protein [Myxococcales bacterium]
MTPETTLDELDVLLTRERAAIVALDSETTLRLAEEKATLMDRLGPMVRGRADLEPRLRASTRKLRDNCLLLAHARDCLRDVMGSYARELNASSPASHGPRPNEAVARRGLKISVKG